MTTNNNKTKKNDTNGFEFILGLVAIAAFLMFPVWTMVMIIVGVVGSVTNSSERTEKVEGEATFRGSQLQSVNLRPVDPNRR